MDKNQFVDAIVAAVYRVSIAGVTRLLRQPPGRRPREDLVALSEWYNQLPAQDRSRVHDVIRLSVDQSVFGFLSALDGVRTLGEDVELRSSTGHVLSADHDLHDLFRELADQENGHDV